MAEAAQALAGGCLCGAVRYRIDGPIGDTGHCHCTMCRRASGAPYVTWTVMPAASFAWVKGEPCIYRSSAQAERLFCGTCGSPLAFRRRGVAEVEINTATLDRPEGVTPASHSWVADRIRWGSLPEDGLTRYEGPAPADR